VGESCGFLGRTKQDQPWRADYVENRHTNRTDCAAGHMQRQQQTTPVYGFSLAEILQLPGRKGRGMR